jgi:DNA phosphorothioation-associated putative methyltransferase
LIWQESTSIQRHRTAIRRTSFSRPVGCVLRDSLLESADTLFDYGCGHGQDLSLLAELGVTCSGWDPVHRPDGPKAPADVVNLGYVINVIEDPRERTETLRRAWEMSRRLLVVAAQTEYAAPAKELTAFSDGVLTSRGTFQKYYSQAELRSYLEESLGTVAIPAAPGVFYLFKCEDAQQEYLANRYRRRVAVPSKRVSEVLFDQNQDILSPFMEALARLGRLPGPEELPQTPEIVERLGSLKRAFALVRRVTEEEPWAQIAQRRTEDLLVYLALARFRRRPPFSKLPARTQRDVKAFLGNYKDACEKADALLFRAGDAAAVNEACRGATTGVLRENALLLRRDALDQLDPLLRVYEGCARALLGDIEEANVLKLHRYSGKVSYLVYDGLDGAHEPTLRTRIKVSLRSLDIEVFNHTRHD